MIFVSGLPKCLHEQKCCSIYRLWLASLLKDALNINVNQLLQSCSTAAVFFHLLLPVLVRGCLCYFACLMSECAKVFFFFLHVRIFYVFALSDEFPELQRKLQSALTLEVEAVRFLKEEPQKMDSMLKRVRALTETLSCMRRYLEKNPPVVHHFHYWNLSSFFHFFSFPNRQVSGSSRSARADPLKQGPPTIHSPHSSPTLQPRCSVKVPPFSVNLTSSASPATARRMSTEATHHDHNTSFTPNLRPDSSAAMQVLQQFKHNH